MIILKKSTVFLANLKLVQCVTANFLHCLIIILLSKILAYSKKLAWSFKIGLLTSFEKETLRVWGLLFFRALLHTWRNFIILCKLLEILLTNLILLTRNLYGKSIPIAAFQHGFGPAPYWSAGFDPNEDSAFCLPTRYFLLIGLDPDFLLATELGPLPILLQVKEKIEKKWKKKLILNIILKNFNQTNLLHLHNHWNSSGSYISDSISALFQRVQWFVRELPSWYGKEDIETILLWLFICKEF